jgi:ABC-type proline/glycine betaine transport system permease subunit
MTKRKIQKRIPLFFALRCYIILRMRIQSYYRRMSDYLAVPLALLASSVLSLALAVLITIPLDFLVEKLLHRENELGISLLVWFCAAPSLAVLVFVSWFSILINWHHATTWRTPTFACALGTILLWLWARDFGGIGLAWYAPGIVTWIVCCLLLRRKGAPSTGHVLQA